jgi:multidrug efflux pump
MSLLLLLFGIVSFFTLGIREYPQVDPPIVTVTTVYTGANAEVIQSQITDPLEEAINGIEGVRTLSSVSADQSSLITVEFNLGMDLDNAANDVRDRVSKSIRFLPKDIDPPIVEKLNANANPIVFMTVSSDTHNILEVSDLAANVIKERMQTIQGVAAIKIFGEKKWAMRLRLDPAKLAANGVTAGDVQKALERENVELPSGRIEGYKTELGVRTLGLMHTPEEFDNLIVKQSEGTVVRLRDLGHAELGAENERSVVKENFHSIIPLGIIPQPGANSIAIADEFYKRMQDIRKEIPEGYNLSVGFDFTTFERNAVKEVQETIIIALLLVIVIIYFFLRDWRSTLIPVIAIPVSIIGTFSIMALAGLSINVLTLLGIVLAIGLVCDDAIVVLENIFKKIDLGVHPMAAAHHGMKEIFFAVISTTVTLAAVFLPLMFLQGLTGRLFREFAIVVAGSVLLSAFVALTLSPMMCSRILTYQRHLNMNFVFRISEPFFLWLNRKYRYSLKSFMRRRWLVFPIFGIIIILIFLFGGAIHSELAPLEDRSNIRIPVLAPEGSSLEFTEKYMDEISRYVQDSIPEAEKSYSLLAPSIVIVDPVNTGTHLIYLSEPEKRKRTQKQIYLKTVRDLQNIPGIRVFPFEPPTIGDRMGGQALQYVLLAPSLKELMVVLPKFLEEARKEPQLMFVDANLKFNRPELDLDVDRDKAAQLGVSTTDVARTLQLLLSDQRYGYFILNGKQYQVIGQVRRGDRDTPAALEELYVRGSRGDLIPLSNLVKSTERVSPASIYTFNRYISATVSAGLAQGATLGDGIAAMDRTAQKVLPKNVTTALSGQSRDYKESSSSLMYVFLLSILIIYLVLAAQFESFVDPLIILCTVPLALAGALFALWYFHQTLNIFSEIGIIMLIGLVTKNGILIVEFANQRKRSGLAKLEAVQRASISRLRPILMTSSAMALGILPIALSLGSSSGSRQSLGIAVVGGLVFSTFLTLYVIPALYSYFSRMPRLDTIDYSELTVEVLPEEDEDDDDEEGRK